MAKRTHISKRADGKAWVVSFRQADNDGRPRFYQSFNFDKYGGEQAAKAAAKLAEAQAMARQARGQTEHARVTVTFREAADRWHAHGVAKGWRASTASDYRSCLDSRLIPEFGHLPIAKLNEQRIEAWLETARAEILPRTVTKLMFVGGAVLQRAHHEWPGYTANPFRDIEKGTKPERPPIEIFTPEEAAAIVRAGENEQDRCIFLLAWRAGVRRGEIPPLRVGDVDFVGRKLHVRRNYVHGAITTPKGKRERYVPLNKSVARAMEDLLRERGDPDDAQLLFPGDDGELLDPDGLRRRFKTAMTTAGVVRPLSLKHLRHTYSSHLAACGVDPWKIQEWAGHASITTTQLYVAVFAPKDDHAEAVDAAFGEPAEMVDAAFGEPSEPVGKDVVAELKRQLAQMAETLERVQAAQEA